MLFGNRASYNLNSRRKLKGNERYQIIHLTLIIILIIILIYTLKNRRLKITELEKARFIKMNELKVSQIELF